MSTQTATFSVLRTLCLFGSRGGRLSISDVMQDLGVSRATAYRYLSNLETVGLACRFGRGDYVLGPQVMALACVARTGGPLQAAAEDVLQSLCRSTGATVLLERCSGPRLVVAQLLVGPHGPVRLSEWGAMQPVDLVEADRIQIQGNAGQALDRRARSGKRVSDSERDLICLVDGEAVEAAVCARTVQRQGVVVGRLVALLRPDGLVSITGAEEQLRRAALRLEGRLEA